MCGVVKIEVLKAYVSPDSLLRLLINRFDRDEEVALLERAGSGEIRLFTPLFALWEAVASIDESDDFDVDMLMRILQLITVETKFEDDLKKYYKRFSGVRKARLREAALVKSGWR